MIETAGVLGTGVQPAICYREGMIVFLRNSSELTAINPRACTKNDFCLKKTAKWFTLFHFKPPFLFSPLRKIRKKKKRRKKITLVSPYTLSNMFSYYVYKIRKLCPFLHYWVINLSSLSGSPVKPSSKMNYSCRQQSGACMSLSFSMYVQTNKSICVCIHMCLYTYIFPFQWKIK